MTIRALGYQTLTSEDILLDGYSTFRMESLMEINSFKLDSITIKSGKPALPFGYFISPEDLAYTAGNFDDPVRVAVSKPGIVQLNDQANHLSVRGKSPVFNTWYLEGLEIVNPNHTSNAGTLSDLPTQYGGGINMFSAQVLGGTNVYTGLNPISIGSAAGASIDMELHESALPEWRVKAGLIGFELGGGAALGTTGILDFNLRYSFTGLLADFGVDFGGERIGFYDGVLAFRKHGKRHTLKLFAWAGRSENEFDKIENVEEREHYKDFFDIDYGNNILGTGARYDLTLGPKMFLRSGFSFSANQSSYFKSGQFGTNPLLIDREDQISVASSFLELSFFHSQRIHSVLGVHYTNRSYGDSGYFNFPYPGQSRIRPLIQLSWTIAPALALDIAGDLSLPFKNGNSIPGYRTMLTYSPGKANHIYFGVRRAAGEPTNRYYPFVSENFELGWEWIGKNQFLSINLYHQKMSRLPAYFLDQAAESFEYFADYPIGIYAGLLGTNHLGVSRHVGIEGQWGYKNVNGWRLDVNQALYKSERGIEGTNLAHGRYDGRFTTHLSAGKEMIRERKGKNRIWNLSMRVLLNGGLWESEIDASESELFKTTVYEYPYLYDQRLPVYKRCDIGVSRTIANSKIRWRYALDIQNLFGFTNIAYHYYDPFLHRAEPQEHLSIIPIFSVQASW